MRFLAAGLVLLWVFAAVAQPYRPELRIAESNGYVTVSWPHAAYYYSLIKKPNLTPYAIWLGVSTAASDFTNRFPITPPQITTNSTADEFSFREKGAGTQAFYGLVGLPPIPLFQFGIYYDGLLEFTTTAAMTVGGPVHANGDIYSGTSTSLAFNRTVTTSGAISYPAWNGQGTNWSSLGDFNGKPPFVTNVARFSVLAGADNSTLHPIANLHALIELPPDDEDPSSAAGLSRFYNQANVVLLVSNETVTARLQKESANGPPAADPAPIIIATNIAGVGIKFPFLSLTNSFTDQREHKVVNVAQIDMGLYRGWLVSNYSAITKFPPNTSPYPTILYVADCRTNSEATMSAVRIANATNVPYNGGRGFTLATPNPLYVWGNYNLTTNSPTSTNPPVSAPAALVCDALTILSTGWKDSLSAGGLSSRVASSAETVNAAIIAGNVPSTGSSATNFSGGVHNLPRLLENWAAATLWLNTSLVCLYPSTVATNQFLNGGVYYNPPTRKFNWDTNFADTAKLPPGCPMVGLVAPDDGSGFNQARKR